MNALFFFFFKRTCRQEIEDCICGVIAKHNFLSKEMVKSSVHLKPQVSIRMSSMNDSLQ